MQARNSGRLRLKGLLIYLAATAAVLVIHAYALHLDDEAQQEVRERIAHQQA